MRFIHCFLVSSTATVAFSPVPVSRPKDPAKTYITSPKINYFLKVAAFIVFLQLCEHLSLSIPLFKWVCVLLNIWNLLDTLLPWQRKRVSLRVYIYMYMQCFLVVYVSQPAQVQSNTNTASEASNLCSICIPLPKNISHYIWQPLSILSSGIWVMKMGTRPRVCFCCMYWVFRFLNFWMKYLFDETALLVIGFRCWHVTDSPPSLSEPPWIYDVSSTSASLWCLALDVSWCNIGWHLLPFSSGVPAPCHGRNGFWELGLDAAMPEVRC